MGIEYVHEKYFLQFFFHMIFRIQIFKSIILALFLSHLDGALNNTDDSTHRQQQQQQASSVTNFSKRKASFR